MEEIQFLKAALKKSSDLRIKSEKEGNLLQAEVARFKTDLENANAQIMALQRENSLLKEINLRLQLDQMQSKFVLWVHFVLFNVGDVIVEAG